jgi:hypothetical protein
VWLVSGFKKKVNEVFGRPFQLSLACFSLLEISPSPNLVPNQQNILILTGPSWPLSLFLVTKQSQLKLAGSNNQVD